MLRKPLLIFTVFSCCPLSYCSNMMAWGFGSNTSVNLQAIMWLIVPYLLFALVLTVLYNFQPIDTFFRPENTVNRLKPIAGLLIIDIIIMILNQFIGLIVLLLILLFLAIFCPIVRLGRIDVDVSKREINWNRVLGVISILFSFSILTRVLPYQMTREHHEMMAYWTWILTWLVGYFAGLSLMFLSAAFWYRLLDK